MWHLMVACQSRSTSRKPDADMAIHYFVGEVSCFCLASSHPLQSQKRSFERKEKILSHTPTSTMICFQFLQFRLLATSFIEGVDALACRQAPSSSVEDIRKEKVACLVDLIRGQRTKCGLVERFRRLVPRPATCHRRLHHLFQAGRILDLSLSLKSNPAIGLPPSTMEGDVKPCLDNETMHLHSNGAWRATFKLCVYTIFHEIGIKQDWSILLFCRQLLACCISLPLITDDS